MDHLQCVLSGLPEDAGRLVVLDGIFSMGEDIAPLPEIVSLCQKYNARLMVDNAHSIGAMGGGRDTATHFGLADQVGLVMGTWQIFCQLGRVHRGLGGCDSLYQAPRPLVDFQCQYAIGQHSGGFESDTKRAGAYCAGQSDRRACVD
ncbi:MAG: aminotransferase class I/II-fold pyridoxal phosphate-dependent enzyme [Chloroflexi bacterium]|nr:aminotransferase class I/II-fold pyridoxal phosphate-dependent enzyme [Chloroflexota bacterium]